MKRNALTFLTPSKMTRAVLSRPAPLSASALLTLALIGCSGTGPMSAPSFSQAALPEAIKVPVGHKVVMESVGVGQLTYECKLKAGTSDQFEWAFVGPEATLNDRAGKAIGKYYGPPATWESVDTSKVSGAQMAVAPAAPGNLALQLVKVNPTTGKGQMRGFSYIQRVATKGGVPSANSCEARKVGQRGVVPYQADYIFWAPL
jgi:Protein of unknown function (DUF3455)